MDKKTSQEIVNMALIILYFLSKLVPELPFWVSSILNIFLNSSLSVTINNDCTRPSYTRFYFKFISWGQIKTVQAN